MLSPEGAQTSVFLCSLVWDQAWRVNLRPCTAPALTPQGWSSLDAWVTACFPAVAPTQAMTALLSHCPWGWSLPLPRPCLGSCSWSSPLGLHRFCTHTALQSQSWCSCSSSSQETWLLPLLPEKPDLLLTYSDLLSITSLPWPHAMLFLLNTKAPLIWGQDH